MLSAIKNSVCIYTVIVVLTDGNKRFRTFTNRNDAFREGMERAKEDIVKEVQVSRTRTYVLKGAKSGA